MRSPERAPPRAQPLRALSRELQFPHPPPGAAGTFPPTPAPLRRAPRGRAALGCADTSAPAHAEERLGARRKPRAQPRALQPRGSPLPHPASRRRAGWGEGAAALGTRGRGLPAARLPPSRTRAPLPRGRWGQPRPAVPPSGARTCSLPSRSRGSVPRGPTPAPSAGVETRGPGGGAPPRQNPLPATAPRPEAPPCPPPSESEANEAARPPPLAGPREGK